jgi:hypothetical protein
MTTKGTTVALPELLPQDQMVRNILDTYAAASAEQAEEGRSWYRTTHHLAVRLDPANPLRAAGVISALSPRMDWGRNTFLAVRTYEEGRAYGCLGSSCRKAQAIFDGAPVLETLKAAKTVAFAKCIADPDDAWTVVVDRHAISIAIGRNCTDDDANLLKRKGVYDAYADAYRKAAAEVGTLPSTVQAVTWVMWRETNIRNAAAVRRQAGR